jgi:clan AA aspartic protease
MIIGHVNAFRQPVITLSVRDANGQAQDYPATIDTGFSGFLTLAPNVIASHGLPFFETRFYTLGDGSDIEMRLYRASIFWDGQDRIVLAVEADGDAMIGMEMLEDHTLFVDVRDNGEVRIAPRP